MTTKPRQAVSVRARRRRGLWGARSVWAPGGDKTLFLFSFPPIAPTQLARPPPSVSVAHTVRPLSARRLGREARPPPRGTNACDVRRRRAPHSARRRAGLVRAGRALERTHLPPRCESVIRSSVECAWIDRAELLSVSIFPLTPHPAPLSPPPSPRADRRRPPRPLPLAGPRRLHGPLRRHDHRAQRRPPPGDAPRAPRRGRGRRRRRGRRGRRRTGPPPRDG